jgi:hypothetical protein
MDHDVGARLRGQLGTLPANSAAVLKATCFEGVLEAVQPAIASHGAPVAAS